MPLGAGCLTTASLLLVPADSGGARDVVALAAGAERALDTAAGLDPDKTVVEKVSEPTGLSSLLGAKRAWGTSLPLSALGEKAVASADLCSVTAPIAYAGDLSGVCGNS